MGRRARFKGLNASLKNLRTPGSNTNPEPPAGSILGEYVKYKKGEKNITYTRQAGSVPGGYEQRILALFGLGATDNTAVTDVSKRALAGATGLTEADLGLAASGTAWAFEGDFIPARAIVRVITGAASSQTSKITNRPYKAKAASSYTLPFGQGAGASYVAACKAISNKSENETRNVSFLPEDILDVL